MSQTKLPLTRADIEQIIPHRDPFLLIDEIVEFVDGEKMVGVKHVSGDEFFFPGHFPGRPIMPGVLMLEALAQLGAVFCKLSTDGSSAEKLIVFTGADNVRFRRLVVPGETLRLVVFSGRRKFGHWKLAGEVYVGDEMAVSATLMAAEVA